MTAPKAPTFEEQRVEMQKIREAAIIVAGLAMRSEEALVQTTAELERLRQRVTELEKVASLSQELFHRLVVDPDDTESILHCYAEARIVEVLLRKALTPNAEGEHA